MLNDWSNNALLNGFKAKPTISTDLELISLKWSNDINKLNILHWFDKWYIVPTSQSFITPAIWLQIYQIQPWKSFDEYVIWLKSCYIVAPMNSCTCPNGMKHYICKHSVGLAMLLNVYQMADKTRSELLGKRRGKGRSKKVRSALLH